MSAILKSRVEGLAAELREVLAKHDAAPTPETSEAVAKATAELEVSAKQLETNKSGGEALSRVAAILGAAGGDNEPTEKAAEISSKSFAERIANSDVLKSFTGGNRVPIDVIKAPLTSSRPASGSSTASGYLDMGGLMLPEHLGVRDLVARRRYMWSDLMSHVPVGNGTVEWVEMLDDMIGNDAAETAEGTAKPVTGGFKYVKRTAAIKTIPILQEVTRQTLRDVPRMQNLIEAKLTKKIRSRVNAQVAAGNGTGENLLGILDSSRSLPKQLIGSDPLFIAVLKAIQKVETGSSSTEDEDLFTVNAMAVHPDTWLSDSFATARDTTGRFILVDPRERIDMAAAWGIPVIQSKKVPAGQVLVGDFSMAEIYDRQEIEMFVSDSHNDNFGKNIIAILAEVALGFEVVASSAFCLVATA